jgi:hypothetical protein
VHAKRQGDSDVGVREPGGDVDDEHLGFAAGQSVGELAFQSVGRDDLNAVEGVENSTGPRAVSVR